MENFMRFILVTTILTLFSNTAFSTEYIYRDLMANTLPSIKCETSDKAKVSATKPYRLKRYVKKFCQTQGYGWGVEEVKNEGKVVCNECSDDNSLQQCFVEDMVVTCRLIRPGSVGMLPGKG